KVVWCHLPLPPQPAAVPVRPWLLAAVVLNGSGQVTDWTAGATELLGWPAGDMLGRPFADLLPGGPAPDPAEAAARPDRLIVLHRDGHRVPLRSRFLPVGAAVPAMVLLAPEGHPDPFEPPAVPAPEGERQRDALAALDSDRLPAHQLPQRAAEACCDYLGGDVGYLMLLDDNGELRMAGSTGLPAGTGSYVEQTEDVLRADQ